MLKRLLKKLNTDHVRTQKEYTLTLSSRLEETFQSLTQIIGESDDIKQKKFLIGKKTSAILFFIDGMSDIERLDQDVVMPLHQLPEKEAVPHRPDSWLKKLLEEVILITKSRVTDSFDQAIPLFLAGAALLVIDGVAQIVILDIATFEDRGVEEPQSEIVIRGPRDGFTENLKTNISLLRRRILDPNFTLQLGKLGRRSKKNFALLYMKGITNMDLVEEIRYRISCVDIDDIPETGTLEQLIEDNPLSVFPQVMHTERPDKTVAALLNGHVIVLIDGTPFSIVAPITLQQLFKSPEDYYEKWQIGSLIRTLRFFAAFIALFLPALYIAMVAYHHGMIPTTLALSIAGARDGVPFPAFAEALFMEITIELLREAGVRLPRPVGQTIGIVGGLVIGDAAVRAGIVSPVMIIVVAITTIASFSIPSYSVSITFRILRFTLMVAAAIFGLYGIVIVYILINIHLVGLRSLGSFYTSPFAPYRFIDWLDLLFRAPISLHRIRSDEPNTVDNKRQR